MDPLSRKLSAAAAGTLLAGSFAVFATPSPAMAAPGDASARGVVVDLGAAPAGVQVISSEITVGEATAPSDGGTDRSAALDIGVDDLGVVLDGTVAEVSATRGDHESSAEATITDLGLGLLGIDVLSAEVLSAAATCPSYGEQQAETTTADLELLGESVTLDSDSPSVDADVGVDLVGLLSAQLQVALDTTETTTVDGATAIAVTADVGLHATLLGIELPVTVGSVILAEATCERPV